MVIGIVGSRNFSDFREMERFIFYHLPLEKISGVVSGGAKGADTLAEKFAEKHNLPLTVHPAEWDKHGKSAGVIRNDFIVNDADILFAFPLEGSIGTFDSIRKAYKKKIKVYVYAGYGK